MMTQVRRANVFRLMAGKILTFFRGVDLPLHKSIFMALNLWLVTDNNGLFYFFSVGDMRYLLLGRVICDTIYYKYFSQCK